MSAKPSLPPITGQHCPECKRPLQPGEMICSVCGTSWMKNMKTMSVIPEHQRIEPDFENQDHEFVTSQTLVILKIGDQEILLPEGERIVIGRKSEIGLQPDVDLNPYNGEAQGVSRRHIEIRHRGPAVLVSDLGSSNGTWINGLRVMPTSRRLLHDGDELQLAHMKMKVQFKNKEQEKPSYSVSV